MYFNVFFQLIKVHLLVSALYNIIIQLAQKALCWISKQLQFDSKQRQDTDIICMAQRPNVSCAHPPLYSTGTQVFPPEVKWVRHTANHSTLSCPKVKTEWSYMSALPYPFKVCTSTITTGYMFWHSSATFTVLNI